MVFVLSAAFASLAGSLYAHTVNFISPSTFGFIVSVELVVMVVIGGMASIWGALIGAGTITLLVEWLRSLGEAVPAFKEYRRHRARGDPLLVMIFMPTGLICGIRDLVLRWFRRRTQPAPVAANTVKEVARNDACSSKSIRYAKTSAGWWPSAECPSPCGRGTSKR